MLQGEAQHRAVERSIVRNYGLVMEKLFEFRPLLSERTFITSVQITHSMQGGIEAVVIIGSRLDVYMFCPYQLAILNYRRTHRTDTTTVRVGGFEVDGDEVHYESGFRGLKNRGGFSITLRYHLKSNPDLRIINIELKEIKNPLLSFNPTNPDSISIPEIPCSVYSSAYRTS